MVAWALALALASGGAGFAPGPEVRASAECARWRVDAVGAHQIKLGAASGYRWGGRALVTTGDALYLGAGVEARGYVSRFEAGAWRKAGWAPVVESGWRGDAGRARLRLSGPATTPNRTWVATGYLEARLWRHLSGWCELSGTRFLQAGRWERDAYGSLGLAWRW